MKREKVGEEKGCVCSSYDRGKHANQERYFRLVYNTHTKLNACRFRLPRNLASHNNYVVDALNLVPGFGVQNFISTVCSLCYNTFAKPNCLYIWINDRKRRFRAHKKRSLFRLNPCLPPIPTTSTTSSSTKEL